MIAQAAIREFCREIDRDVEAWSQGLKPPKEALPLSTAELADLLAGKQASRVK
jgi:hypothetical protein